MNQSDTEQFLESFRVGLKKLRLKRGITAYRLAQSSGLSPQAIAAYEQGTRTPGLEYIQKLAKGFEMTASEFLKELGL